MALLKTSDRTEMQTVMSGPRDKNRKDDIILELKPKEGKNPLNSGGVVDKRLFNGENKLHVFRDPVVGLWRLKMDSGNLPAPLQQHFTKYELAKYAAETYYGKRNVEISKVID